MSDEPRRGPGRPRKASTGPSTPVSAPPGPITLEIRAGRVGEQTKILCSQRVHGYKIDQTDDKISVTGVLRAVNDNA